MVLVAFVGTFSVSKLVDIVEDSIGGDDVCVGGVCRVHAKDIFLNLHKNSAKSPMWDKLRITDRSTANGRAHSRLPHCMTGHHTVLGYSADRHSDRHIRLGEGNGACGASRRDGEGVTVGVSIGASVRVSAAGTWTVEHWEADPVPWDGRTVA